MRTSFRLRRLIGVGVLAALCGLTTAGVSRGLSARNSRRVHVPPFALGALSGSLLGSGARWTLASPSLRPRVIIYASESCAHCHKELARWARLAQKEPQLFSTLDVSVVSGDLPTPSAALGALVPAGLPHSRVNDDTHSIARALGVTSVPTIAYIDRAGVVRRLTVGETSDAVTRTNLRTLNIN
jgi:hypothetical protein